MKRKNLMFGVFLFGIIFLTASLTNSVAIEDDLPGDDYPEEPEEPKEPEEPEEPKEEPYDDDDDDDGVDDNFEDDNKRDVSIWIGENVVEMGSIRRHGDQKDIIDMRVGFGGEGISVRVSFGTIAKNPDCGEEKEEAEGEEIDLQYENDCELIQHKLKFEVWFRGLIEFVDKNDNDILDFDIDEIIEDYGFNSFQQVEYSLTSISNDSSLHYILLNTTDGVFATHIYFVEEFVYVDETLISPTQVKIDIEITNFNYTNPNSQLALHIKLWSEAIGYEEREETKDEKDGYANEEKEVYIHNEEFTGIFSWKEIALIDGVEMPVLTKRIVEGGEYEHLEKLYISYPRGNHIYHDPKIGIYISIALQEESNLLIQIIITSGIVSVIGIATVAFVVMKKRRII